MSDKYPRTPHFPWSGGAARDDKVAETLMGLYEHDLVITEKLDGSNIAMTRDHLFARSHSGPPKHESFDMLKSFHASMRHHIPEHCTIFGEWMYAIHSIEYRDLETPGPFVFAVRYDFRGSDGAWWAAWDSVERMAMKVGCPTVPVISSGLVTRNEDILEGISSIPSGSRWGGECEGVVVRQEDGFLDPLFPYKVMKNVREDHVQTSEHWAHEQIRRQPFGSANAVRG